MKIKSVTASWVHIPIPPERQHTSDFGKTPSFDGTIVRVETECGIAGWGEAKSQVGGSPAGFIVEYSLGANPLLHDLVEEDFPVNDGQIEVPERSGLGITVREDFLQKHAVAR